MQVNRKSIMKSRKAWTAFLSGLSVLKPILQNYTDIDVVAFLGAADQVVQVGLNLAAGVLVLLSIVRPDKHGTEPEFIAKRR